MNITISTILFPIIATVVVFVFGVMFAKASEKCKQKPLNSVDYERLEAESIEKECEEYDLSKI